MPKNFVTHAQNGKPDQPGSDNQSVFFDATSVTNYSFTFDVNDQPWYLQAFNLAENDTVTVQMVSGSGSGVFFGDLYQIGILVQLTATNNKIRVDMPGRYRLVFGGDAVNAIRVTGFPATMTQESIGVLAQGFTELLNSYYTASVVVQGGTSIQVTGMGGVLDPYIINFVALDAISFINGDSTVITGDGSSGNPFIVNLTDTIGVGIVPQPNTRTTLSGTTPASQLGKGLWVAETLGANATGYDAIQVFPTIGTGSGNLQLKGINVVDPFGTGNTPASLFGYYADALTKGAANYGFYTAQGLGANNWSFYANEARSHFGTEGIVLPATPGGVPSDLSNGQIWFDGSDFKVRIGGVTKTITVT